MTYEEPEATVSGLTLLLFISSKV